MLGKWVGHPAQLFATMLAFQEGAGDDELAAEAEKLERYRDRTAAGEGAAMIAGEMADRATDRHARMLLRRAVADGRFDPERALTLGVITAGELADARALGSPRS
jgi:citrate lyase beta subunit